MRTRLLPVVVLIAFQQDIAILHILYDAKRTCPNGDTREITVIRKTGGRIDRAAEIHHVVELIDVGLRERQPQRQLIQRLCSDEVGVIVLKAA